MASAKSPRIAVKLLINRATKKILYMEAGKEFVDLLFSFLALPVGTVTKLLYERGLSPTKMGSLSKLYESILKLQDSSFVVTKTKLLNLRPTGTPPCNLLLLGAVPGEQQQLDSLFRCGCCYNSDCRNHISTEENATCPACGNRMNTKIQVLQPSTTTNGSALAKGYVKENVTFLITDDLSVMPMSTIESIALLVKLKPEKMSDLESSEANVGVEEALELLRASVSSQTVLNDVFGVGLSTDTEEDSSSEQSKVTNNGQTLKLGRLRRGNGDKVLLQASQSSCLPMLSRGARR